MNNREILRTLIQVAKQYPENLRDAQLRDTYRIAFHIGLVLDELKPKTASELELADLGGGIGLFSIGCAALGFKRVLLMDDFDDPVNREVGDSVLDLHRSSRVTVISRDVVASGIEDIDGSFDAITTFDSMEHWHHSPKRLFHTCVDKLKAGGLLLIGVPNAVNLRKRITIPFGYGKWTSMQDWYEQPRFRSHVREPDVEDLNYIARDLGLKNWRILGRNWLGFASNHKLIRFATKLGDPLLQRVPSLCADIYLVGRKE